jgi:hypothetical protein
MAITVEEKIESREVSTGDRAAATLRYVIRGTDDDYEAWGALGTEAPAEWHGLVRTSHEVQPVHVEEGHPARCVWEGIARYGRRKQQPETNESRFSFDTGGGTQHITNSLETVGCYGDPDEDFITDHLGVIGWDGQAVQGIDITVPVYRFTEVHYLPVVYVTESYKRDLFWLTGRVNSVGFRGFAVGEVLFLRASGSQRSSEDWEISFQFAASPNATDLKVGNITGIHKRGWEYMWTQFKTAAGRDKDSGEETGDLIPKPKAVFIEQVYRYGDFSKLGIGT